MEQTKILPFFEKPIFTIYNNYNFITGIIQGNNNNTFEPWAYGRFINCAFNPGFGFRVFGTPDMLDVTKDLGHHRTIRHHSYTQQKSDRLKN